VAFTSSSKLVQCFGELLVDGSGFPGLAGHFPDSCRGLCEV
jgi:hypothetical protein